MKHTRHLTAILLLVVLLAVTLLPLTASAANGTLVYSTSSNSGTRHVLCTTLDGTSFAAYYTGEYTFAVLSQLSGDSLRAELNELMEGTHKKNSTYADCRDMAGKTDCEKENGLVNLIYTSYSAKSNQSGSGAGTWNREHVWPKSLGGYETSGPGADLHHIRPSDASVNSKRSNNKYGEVSGGKNATGSSLVNSMVGGTYGGGYFEPLDNAKGDVARICLYMYVRYGYDWSKCNSITNVFQSVDVLLEWCALDPVDTWEMGRNEVVAAYQGNRNVFIDYPELAWTLFGKTAPANMSKPSDEAPITGGGSTGGNTSGGGTSGGNTSGGSTSGGSTSGGNASGGSTGGNATVDPAKCSHTNTELQNVKEATCTQNGYSGDKMCKDCKKKLAVGKTLPAAHSFKKIGAPIDGRQAETCTLCGEGRLVDLNGDDGEGPDTVTVVAIAAASTVAVGGATTGVVFAVRIRRRKMRIGK